MLIMIKTKSAITKDDYTSQKRIPNFFNLFPDMWATPLEWAGNGMTSKPARQPTHANIANLGACQKFKNKSERRQREGVSIKNVSTAATGWLLPGSPDQQRLYYGYCTKWLTTIT